MPDFDRYIGIDYSGAETPTSSLKGLRVYQAAPNTLPTEVLPPPSPRKYWTRKGIAHWLVEILSDDISTLVGIDHGFSFPFRYFEFHLLKPEWPDFLDDFQSTGPPTTTTPTSILCALEMLVKVRRAREMPAGDA